MQNAKMVLSVLRERGRRGLPCTQLYRQLFNPQLYLLAYGRLYSNKGAMTPGADGETVDGMSLGKIDRIIDAMRHERYRFRPVRRVWIPKKNGKRRPLGLPLRSSFAGFRFPPDVITLAVRWYLRYGLSYRDVEELLAERGITVDHVTVYRWVQRFTPLLIDAARPCRHAAGDRWFVDETYAKVAG
jgi:hypothetical protein